MHERAAQPSTTRRDAEGGLLEAQNRTARCTARLLAAPYQSLEAGAALQHLCQASDLGAGQHGQESSVGAVRGGAERQQPLPQLQQLHSWAADLPTGSLSCRATVAVFSGGGSTHLAGLVNPH